MLVVAERRSRWKRGNLKLDACRSEAEAGML